MSHEVRDKLAELEGWRVQGGDWVHRDGRIQLTHPIPDDLNTCAAMWDKYAWKHGWTWLVGETMDGPKFFAGRVGEMHYERLTVRRTGHDAASELRDRWALLGEVLKARGVWK